MGFSAVRQKPSWGKQYGRQFLNIIPQAIGTAANVALQSAISNAIAGKYKKEQDARDLQAEKELRESEWSERSAAAERQRAEAQQQQEEARQQAQQERVFGGAATSLEKMGLPGQAGRMRTMGPEWFSEKQEKARRGLSVPATNGLFTATPSIELENLEPADVADLEATPTAAMGRFQEYVSGLPQEVKDRALPQAASNLELLARRQKGKERIVRMKQFGRQSRDRQKYLISQAKAEGRLLDAAEMEQYKSQLDRADVKYSGGRIRKPVPAKVAPPWQGKKQGVQKSIRETLTPEQQDAFDHYVSQGHPPKEAAQAAMNVVQ